MNSQLSESVSNARHLDTILNTEEDTMLLNVGLAEAISEDFNFNVRVLWFVLYGFVHDNLPVNQSPQVTS